MDEDVVATLFGVLVFVGVILFALFQSFIPYKIVINESGSHTGYVTAVEKHGVIFKKYRVYFKTDLSSSQEDTYCVEADKTELVDTLKTVSEQKKRVTLKYTDNWAGANRCRGDEIVGFK